MSADKRQRGRPAMFTDQERLQRKREMARLRQARKRARDRERQSMGRDSLGSGMELDPGDIPEGGGQGGRSESGEHSLNQEGGTDDELDDEELVAKGLEMIASEHQVRQNGSSSSVGENQIMSSHGESRGKGIEVAPQPPVVPGIAPMQLHPDHEIQSIATGAETPIPAVINIHQHERVPIIYDHPRVLGNAAEDEDGDEGGDNHAIIWPWLRRTVRLIESSRNDRKLQEDIYTVLYTEEMAHMLNRESSRPDRLIHQQSELKEKASTTPELGTRSSAPLGVLGRATDEDKESADEMVDELLGHLEGRVQAIKKQKGLKAEVQSLKRDLINKEAQLKEYNAIVDSERAAWRAERAGRSDLRK